MGGSNFDQIAQALLQQQQDMQKLKAENNQLRQQLLDLRSGRGIFVLINGIRVPLTEITSSQNDTSINDETPSMVSTTPALSSAQEALPSAIITAETQSSLDADSTPSSSEEISPSTPLPVAYATPSLASPATQADVERPSFLEDLMLSEFTSAMTSPLQVPASPSTSPTDSESTDTSDKDDVARQQADLKRALIGSYVLD